MSVEELRRKAERYGLRLSEGSLWVYVIERGTCNGMADPAHVRVDLETPHGLYSTLQVWVSRFLDDARASVKTSVMVSSDCYYSKAGFLEHMSVVSMRMLRLRTGEVNLKTFVEEEVKLWEESQRQGGTGEGEATDGY